MASMKQVKRDLVTQGVEEEFLPVAVRVLVINGKRLTPALYKQISEEDLIAEQTAELQGIPLGYFHIHTKECPEVSHRHVLWGIETRLHLATIVARKDDPRYQRQANLSTTKQQQYISLLALALVLAGHSPTIEYGGEHRKKIQISGYTLYSSSTLADLLQSLSKARTQCKKDETLFRKNHPQDEALALQQAETLLERLLSLGLEIAHPLREEITGDIFNRYYGDSGWRTYPAKAEREKALLYWQVKEFWKREQLEKGLREQLEANLTSQSEASSLRYLLASRIVHEQTEKVREQARDFIEIVALAPKKARKSAQFATVDELDPDHLWRCYEQEAKRMKAYTEQWDEHLSAINGVGQLFLV